jgi:hypothetical protein
MAVSVKMAVFWDAALCSLVDTGCVSEKLTALIIVAVNKQHMEML